MNVEQQCRKYFASKITVACTAINAVCFGGCLTLLLTGNASGPTVLLTFATGLSSAAGIAGIALFGLRETKAE